VDGLVVHVGVGEVVVDFESVEIRAIVVSQPLFR
jgi:hypothetical protein